MFVRKISKSLEIHRIEESSFFTKFEWKTRLGILHISSDINSYKSGFFPALFGMYAN